MHAYKKFFKYYLHILIYRFKMLLSTSTLPRNFSQVYNEREYYMQNNKKVHYIIRV